MLTVFVEKLSGRRYREIARDARDPFDAQKAVENLCCVYSRRKRTILVFPDGPYVRGWRQHKDDPLFEAYDGEPTQDFRTVSA